MQEVTSSSLVSPTMLISQNIIANLYKLGKNDCSYYFRKAANLTLLYEQELEEEGYDVDVASSIYEASELINRQLYDLLIVETMLKQSDDIEVLRGKFNKKKEVPLISIPAIPVSMLIGHYGPLTHVL